MGWTFQTFAWSFTTSSPPRPRTTCRSLGGGTRREAKPGTGLLKFMARKTVEAAKLTPEDANRRLKAKIESIETIQAMAQAKRQCMRHSLLKYFEGGSARKRASLALKIVPWLYASRTKIDWIRYCCDHCNKVSATNFRAIAISVLKAA
jgi:hypothetical protein